MKNKISIQLYDADITDLLNGWDADIVLPRSTPDHLGVFEDLQEQELIYAIYQKNYPRAYSLLRKLTHPLSPTDAIAACLCALVGTPRLMNTLLDHCPPIPAFQFQGVGLTASLLNVAVRHDKNKMLDILLSRGADPNGGPTPLTAKSPVEEAFCSTAYSCLKRLLEIPDLNIPLTEHMLETWGYLTTDPAAVPFFNPCCLWCCQLLLEKLTGEPAGLFDPLPVPPQLRLGHALRQANYELAAKICDTRPLTDQDADEVLAHYAADRLECTIFDRNDSKGNLLYTKREQEIGFLCQLLTHRPDLLQTPQLRAAVSLAALAMPEEDPFLAGWVQQMEDGLVLLPALPCRFGTYQIPFQSFPVWNVASEVEGEFFARWAARLGPRLIPTMDINAPKVRELSPDSMRQVLQHMRFVGSPPADALSNVATQVLLHAPEDMLPGLLQSHGLLAQEQPHLLLDACQSLPLARRNLILPYIRKTADYRL